MTSTARHAVHDVPTANLRNPLAVPPVRYTRTPAAPVPDRPADPTAAWRLAADRAEARADVAVAVAVFAVGLLVIVAGVWAAVRLFL